MESLTTLIITSFSPYPTISFLLPSNLPISTLSSILSPLVSPSSQYLSLTSGLPLSIHSSQPLASLHSNNVNGETKNGDRMVNIRLAVRLPGGKGGFASQLRAQGGRMSSNKATNNDSCRDLNGRRLSTIKEAKKIATYIETEPLRQQALKVASALKVESLNIEIARLDGGESTGNVKRKLDDNTYVEESREIVAGVRDAVKEAMMKKKKRKVEAAAAAAAAASASGSTSTPIIETSNSIASGSGSKTVVVEVEAIPVEEGLGVVEEEVEVEVAEVEEVVVKKGKGRAKGKGKA